MAKQIPCFFLIIFSFYLQAHARESKFFSKSLHLTTNTLVTIPSTKPKHLHLPSPSPSPSPITSQISGVPASAPNSGPAPAPAPTTLGAGYGSAPAPITLGIGYDPAPAPTTLGAGYGSAPAPTTLGAGYNPAPAPATLGADYGPTPAPATLGTSYGPTPTPPENETPYYGLYAKDTNTGEEETPSKNPEEANNRESYSYRNGESSSLSSNNGFWTSEHRSYYSSNNGYDELESEPQGMSDTRLADNGRYYSDVGQENYNPRGSNYRDDNEEGYYGNYRSKYEFDSMEEYEKQEGYGDVEQFIP